MPNEENIGDLQACGFEPLLNLKEAAVILGMHWKTLEGMVRNREIPALKGGKGWKFRLRKHQKTISHLG